MISLPRSIPSLALWCCPASDGTQQIFKSSSSSQIYHFLVLLAKKRLIIMRAAVLAVAALFLGLAALAPADACGGKSCPRYWHFYGGSCFRYFGDPLSWTAARGACQGVQTNQGRGDLVALRDDDMSEFVYQLYRLHVPTLPSSGYLGFWVGITRSTTSPWHWSSSAYTSWSYTNWLPNEPNNRGTDENCAHSGHRRDDDRWNDVRCNVTLPYVCIVEPYFQA